MLVFTLQGKRQTITTQADIRADRSSDDNYGVYVVIVMEEDQGCGVEKTLTVTAVKNLPVDDYAVKVAFMLSWFMLPMLIFFLLLAIELCRRHGFLIYEVQSKPVDVVGDGEELVEDEVRIIVYVRFVL